MLDPANNRNQIENKSADIRLVVFGYRQYNIVHCQGLYYGWPWPAGEFSLEKYTGGTFPTAVAGKSIPDVKKLIDEKLGPPAPEEENRHDWLAELEMEEIINGKKIAQQAGSVRQAVSGYRQYDIFHCQGLYFGWPCSVEGFTWEKYLRRTVHAAVIGKSIMSVKNLIDVKLGPPSAEEEERHNWINLQQNEDAESALFIQAKGLLEKEKSAEAPPKNARLLLIKQWGFGFWSDMEDVWAKLLLAEITNRQPIIYWGKDSLFSVGETDNSFEQYFLPVSGYSIADVVNSKYSYYPPIWNSLNLFQTDPNRFSRAYRDVSSFINCDANVLVSDVHNFMYEYSPWINENHPAYGLREVDIYHDNIETEPILNAYRYIHNKYIKLQPDIEKEIDEFYQTHMKTGPILAVHVRGGAKFYENPHWNEVIDQYPREIASFLKDNPSGRIFLLTDDEAILEKFKQLYGDVLIFTDCTRKTVNDLELCLKVFPVPRRKGIEIIKDTYLACKCDYFIGNWGSNVFRAIRRLKVWENDKIKMLN